MPLPELLAPLNNWKSLSPQTHVLEHADAVYFGLQANFSMRARASNFPVNELSKLMDTIHAAGKKGYLTTNILIYNKELIELHQTIELAKQSGVDAIICHDLAAIMICKQLDIPFHISTQANISNKIAAKFYESLGAERIILARELDLPMIKEIATEVSIPLETFVHGAMCTAVSGRCYLSAELMGSKPEFSANRGKCVQPCRRMYTFQGEEGEQIEFEPASGMFFNAKDLCMVGHIPELVEAGVQSFKIEGRMRDPLYLAEVVSCYREAIQSHEDDTYTQEKVDHWLARLSQVFNRGFHTGFYFSQPSPDDIERTVRGNISKTRKKQVGKVINYYKKASAVEIELFSGQQLEVGQTLIFQNKTSFFHTQEIISLRLENQSVQFTPRAAPDQHIFVGIQVSTPVPMNANVYLITRA